MHGAALSGLKYQLKHAGDEIGMLRTYAQVMPEQRRALADKMESLLLGGRTG